MQGRTSIGGVFRRAACKRLQYQLFSFLIISVVGIGRSFAQDTMQALNPQVADRYIKEVDSKANSFNSSVDKYTGKSVDRLIRREKKMKAKLEKSNPELASQLFDYSIDSLSHFKNALKNKTEQLQPLSGTAYFPYADTLKQSLAFINNIGQHASLPGKNLADAGALNSVQSIGNTLSVSSKLEEYLKDRQDVLTSQLKNVKGFSDDIRGLQKEAYYYSAQIGEYKNILSDQSRLEALVRTSLSKIPAFGQFVSRNSQLAGLFAFNGSAPSGSGNIPIVNGIPDRYALQQSVQNNLPVPGGNISQAVGQQMQSAEAGIDQLKSKLNAAGGMSENVPPDFKPNTQKTKSLWQRLEYGSDVQFGKGSGFLPTTADLAAKVGYKINDKNSFGMGLSYKLGLGSGLNNIRFTSQGIGFRSYIDCKIKGSFYVQGGSEWTYNTGFTKVAELKDYSRWQQAALIGLNKKYHVSKKMTGNMQILYDFLANRHIPTTQPVLFRVGYGL